MSNEVTIIVRAKNDTKAALDQTRADMARGGDEAGKAFGEKLTRGIDGRLRDASGRFVKEFGGLGEKGGDSLRKGFSGKLLQLGKDVTSTLTEGLAKFGTAMPGFLGDAIGKLPPQGQALAGVLVAGLAASLAPMLGAAVSSAVLLMAGGGVLAAGIALVAKQPAVKAAFGKLKNELFDQDTKKIEDKVKAANERLTKAQALGSAAGIKSAKYDLDKAKAELEKATNFNKANESLKDLARSFEGPLARAAGTFADTIHDLKPDIKDLFDTMAPVIDKMAKGLSGFLKESMPGIKDAVKASKPLFDTLAEHLPKIGAALSSFFTSIADSGPEANQFFSDLLTFIEGLIIALGKVIGWLTKMYGAWREGVKTIFPVLNAAVNLWMASIGQFVHAAAIAFGWIPGLGPKLRAADREFTNFRAKVNAELAKIKNKTVNVNANTAQGLRNINQFRQTLANLDGSVATVYVRGQATGIQNLGGRALAHGGIMGAAMGRIAGGMTWVGEQGPELVNLPAGARVHSNPDSMRMARDTGKGHAAPTIVISPGLAGDQPLIRAILNSLRFEIAGQGGNVQTVLGRG